MFSRLNNRMKASKKSHGFSLVELLIVIVILAILAVAVFAGGSIAIKKAQVSQVTSDLHNFSVAIESTLNENPGVAGSAKYATAVDGSNVATTFDKNDIADILTKLNQNLPADYQLNTTPSKVQSTSDAKASTWVAFQSKKTDAWDNAYIVYIDTANRNTTKSEFFITVISMGPDAKTEATAGEIGADDIFLVGQYSDGNVAAMTFNYAEAKPEIATATTAATNYVTATSAPVIIK